jgi:hypothetical protein
MTDQEIEAVPSEPIYINESTASVNFLWGFATLAIFALAALVLFAENAENPTANKIVAIVLGVVGGGFIAYRWTYEIRHPARLEITYEAVRQTRRGRDEAKILPRTTGEFRIYMKTAVVGAGHPAPYLILVAPDTEVEIELGHYDHHRVGQALKSVGWMSQGIWLE